MKSALPKGLFVLVCLLTSANVFAADLRGIRKNLKAAILAPHEERKVLHPRVERMVAYLKGVVVDGYESLYTRTEAVRILVENYYNIGGIDELLQNVKQRLFDRDNRHEMARYIGSMVAEEKEREEAIIKFGGPIYLFGLPDSVRE